MDDLGQKKNSYYFLLIFYLLNLYPIYAKKILFNPFLCPSFAQLVYIASRPIFLCFVAFYDLVPVKSDMIH